MRKYQQPAFIAVISAIIFICSCKTHFETTKATYTAPKTTSAFDRGKVLVVNICGGCHYDRSAGKFIGTRIHEVPGIIGKVYSANLTNSTTHGISPRYTDAELKYLLKTGITKSGHFLPYMLRPNMAEEDLDAIIVYLRSGDSPVAAADTTVGPTHLSPLGHTVMDAMAKPLAYKQGVKLPPENDNVAKGKYLVDNIGCFHCHSKSLNSLNYLDIEQTKGYMAGGMKFKNMQGFTIYASNLTSDKQTGIGNYTQTEFRNAVKNGEAPARKLHEPMPQFRTLPDDQVDAIYAYVCTLPAVDHKVQGQ